MTSTLYNDDFYTEQGQQSLESATIIAPLVLRLGAIRSVIDIGCGLGGWLRAFSDNGVAIIRGVDGDYVDRSRLYIPSECFTAADLTQHLNIEGLYDLAVCLEVAEHLHARAGADLVKTLTNLAPLILFSSAVPGQGGIGHINEQWPKYWQGPFKEQGFTMLDLIRPPIRDDPRVEWWYRQIIVMFASEAAMHANPALCNISDSRMGIEWVHVDMLCPPHAGVRTLFTHLRPVLSHAIRKRLPGRFSSLPKTMT